jgi:hypothetical protein
MNRSRISRRHALRGALAGAAVRVGLPALALMGRGRSAHAAAPKRLLVFFWGNGRGIDAARWTPATTGAAWTPSPQLMPLAGLKDYVSVVTGFDSKLTSSSRGHHNGCVTMLTGADYKEEPANGAPFRSTFALPSIDQVAAKAIGMSTPFKSLELGVSSRVIRGEGSTLNFVSHNGPDSGNPAEFSPAAVYTRLFSGALPKTGDGGLAQMTAELRKSALDAVLDDLRALEARVGTQDRARLDQHAENIRAIEKRLAMPAAMSACASPPKATDPAGSSGHEPMEERTQLMAKLMATAFACDLTRVATVLFSGSVCSTVFWEVGATGGHHDLSHGGSTTQTVIDASTTFIVKQFGVFLEALRATPEGTGNLLDQSAAMATSDCSNGTSHSIKDMPIVLAGRAGGALRAGLHHHAPSGSDNNTSRVLFSLLRSVGVPLTTFGAGGGLVTSGLPEIEA